MPKYLLIFEKGESVRWLGHLDILRTFERAIRRATLPIVFSSGFNPREKVAFASALGTGTTGEAELMSVELTEPVEPEEIASRLNAVLPVGIQIQDSQPLSDADAKYLLNSMDRADYALACVRPPQAQREEVDAAIVALLAQEEVWIDREREGRVRRVNIRPVLYHLALSEEAWTESRLTLQMIVGQGEGGTARPNEVAKALQQWLPELSARLCHRVRMLDKEGIERFSRECAPLPVAF